MSDRIDKLKSFLQQSPDDCFLNHALALEFIKAGDDGAAQRYFQHNIEVDPMYVATYYHLGKLLERAGMKEKALVTYQEGMDKAKAAKDMHTYSELQAAYEDLAY